MTKLEKITLATFLCLGAISCHQVTFDQEQYNFDKNNEMVDNANNACIKYQDSVRKYIALNNKKTAQVFLDSCVKYNNIAEYINSHTKIPR